MTALVVITLVQVGVGTAVAVAVDTVGTVVGTTVVVAAVTAQAEETEATMLTPPPLAILLRMDPGSASTLTPRGLPCGAELPYMTFAPLQMPSATP
jgi:hypothetical protein